MVFFFEIKRIADVASEFGLTLAEAEQVYVAAERDMMTNRPALPTVQPTDKPVVSWRCGQPVGNGLDRWSDDAIPKV